ncbi:arylesterase [Ventosimonas gracilis]|uniref:Arylesterase n=1 Tax=Ventosimonas gracilis TaxID=1680762 RepID=A0A139SRZ4_9GAMM|nr:arylesterase [Ventosimonas gracilis]KXU37328.1 arylesterase [Ventosimonas gracilis]
MNRLLKLAALLALLCTQTALAGGLLVVGDSISAGFGLDSSAGWVSLLEQRLKQEGLARPVINASISGDTSTGGLSRLPALLKTHQPAVVIIELGGNDGLRGQSPAQLQQNLARMVKLAKNSGAAVLLLGMRLPPNYGKRYTRSFEGVYADVAEQQQIAFVPFFLEGVGGVEGMMQADGIHPTASAQPRLLENLWPLLRPML